MLALFSSLLLEPSQDLFRIFIHMFDLFQFHYGQFDHVKMRLFVEILLALSFVEGLCLDDVLLVVLFVSVYFLYHFRVELLRFPVAPAYCVVGVLSAEFQYRLVVVCSVRARPFA